MKKLIAIIIVSAVILSAAGLMSQAFAADLTEKGYLKVVTQLTSGSIITPIPGIQVKYCLIAAAKTGANGRTTYVPDPKFAGVLSVGSDGRISYVPASDFAALLDGVYLDVNMPAEYIDKWADILTGKNVSGTEKTTDANGEAVLTGLTAGLYLVAQNPSSSGNNGDYDMQAFIVSVPYPDYKLTAYPKLDKKQGTVTVNKEFSKPSDIPADYTYFTVRLTSTEDAALYYDFYLNAANSWTLRRDDVIAGTYNVTEINIPGGYEFVSQSSQQIAVKGSGNVNFKATNRKKVIIETTTPEPTTPESTTPEPTTETVTETTPAPTTPEPTTPTPTTAQESTTEPTVGGNENETTTSATDDITTNYVGTTTTENNIFPHESQPSESVPYPVISIPTIPVITNSLITLPNGWLAEDLGDGLYAIYDGNGVPLGYVQLGDGDDIMTYDVADNLIPLDSTHPTTAAAPRGNPMTGDNFYLTGFVIFVSLLGGVLLLNRRWQWIK